MRTTTAALLACLLLPTAACTGTDDLSISVGVWVSIDPVQCDGNAWDSTGVSVETYYEGLGVSIHTVVSVQVADNTCQACSCPTGVRVYLEIDESNLAFMLAEGFQRTAAPK